nr:macro domain-containing protein [Neptuniibacter marinus]
MDGNEADLLAQSHLPCLELAEAHQFLMIAFPAISCGVYGYSLEETALVALETTTGKLD